MTLVFGAEGMPGRRERAQEGLLQLAEYLNELVQQFRSDPADNLITVLAHAKENDDSLTDEEIVATCTLLLFGGHETTTNLIGNGTLALLRHPDQLADLVDNPDVLPTAVEELLRFDGPSKMEVRRAAADIELRGRTIHEGDQVYLVQSSANRDADEFADARPARPPPPAQPPSRVRFRAPLLPRRLGGPARGEHRHRSGDPLPPQPAAGGRARALAPDADLSRDVRASRSNSTEFADRQSRSGGSSGEASPFAVPAVPAVPVLASICLAT